MALESFHSTENIDGLLSHTAGLHQHPVLCKLPLHMAPWKVFPLVLCEQLFYNTVVRIYCVGGRQMKPRTYIAIDLKSYFASSECVQQGLDPLTTNLVVADASRTEKTICLAVSPSLKAYGIPGRPRLFEVVEKVQEINARRRQSAPGQQFIGSS